MDRSAGPNLSAHLSWENALLTNLRLLGFPSSQLSLSRDLFLRPNKRAFHAVVLFLFDALDQMEAARRFEACRRCSNRKQEMDFAKVTCAWLAELGDEGRLPRVTPSLIAAPQGDKVYEVLTKLSTVVLRRRLVSDLGCGERCLLSPPALPPSGLTCPGAWRASSARALLSGISGERSQLLSRLSRLEPAVSARQQAMQSLESRYRRAGANLGAAEAELAALRGAGGDGIDVGRLRRVQALWRELLARVEGLAPGMREVGAVLEEVEGGSAAVLDGSALATAGQRRVDLAELLGAVRNGAEVCDGERKRTPSARPPRGIEGSARECLNCLQGQIGKMESLIARVDATLPGLESSVASLRGSYRSRRPRHSGLSNGFSPSTPHKGNGAAMLARLSLATPPATPPCETQHHVAKNELNVLLRLKNAAPARTPSSSEATPRRVSSASVTRDPAHPRQSGTPPSTSSDDANLSSLNEESLPKGPGHSLNEESLPKGPGHSLNEERFLKGLGHSFKEESTPKGRDRSINDASLHGISLNKENLSRLSMNEETPPKGPSLSSLNEESLPGLSTRFRLSLDRLGLASSEEEEEEEAEEETSEDIAEAIDATVTAVDGVNGELRDFLVMETSSILLGSSHSDCNDSLEADSLISI